MGILRSKMCQFLIRSISLSTWTRRLAIVLLCSVSFVENCLLSQRNFGVTKTAPTEANSSWQLNPLSAMTSSPFFSLSSSQWGYQGRHEVHQQQVTTAFTNNPTAPLGATKSHERLWSILLKHTINFVSMWMRRIYILILILPGRGLYTTSILLSGSDD